MSNTATLSEVQLRQFTGSENWYRHGINRSVLFTDGAKYVADQGGAYWLLDIIAIAQQHDKSVSTEEFQVWNLKVHFDRSATVFCGDGNGNPVYAWKTCGIDAWMWIPPANCCICSVGPRRSCRRQGRYGQFEKPASAIAGAGVPS